MQEYQFYGNYPCWVRQEKVGELPESTETGLSDALFSFFALI